MVEPRVRESRLLDLLGQRYEERGYAFFKYPPREMLPEFLREYRPDAIALGPKDNVVIEVKSGRGERPAKQIARLFKEQQDWRLDLVFAEDVDAGEPVLSSPARETIDAAISQAKKLKANEFVQAALVIAWSALEAAARLHDKHEEHRTRTTQSLVEFLERDGLVDFETAKDLRSAGELRNRLVHGDFETKVPETAFSLVLSSAEDLTSGQFH
jgi:DNA-binding transcriptional ArsR family regulator